RVGFKSPRHERAMDAVPSLERLARGGGDRNTTPSETRRVSRARRRLDPPERHRRIARRDVALESLDDDRAGRAEEVALTEQVVAVGEAVDVRGGVDLDGAGADVDRGDLRHADARAAIAAQDRKSVVEAT